LKKIILYTKQENSVLFTKIDKDISINYNNRRKIGEENIAGKIILYLQHLSKDY
jgi:hypothetical protein